MKCEAAHPVLVCHREATHAAFHTLSCEHALTSPVQHYCEPHVTQFANGSYVCDVCAEPFLIVEPVRIKVRQA